MTPPAATEPKNLVSAIQDECNRVRELFPFYRSIGPAGAFGLHVLEVAITDGERAIASGDVIRMLDAYEPLKGCK